MGFGGLFDELLDRRRLALAIFACARIDTRVDTLEPSFTTLPPASALGTITTLAAATSGVACKGGLGAGMLPL